MESAPRISFIIPVFNGLELTRECLRSLTETVPGHDHEIVIVDDGSSDGTRDFLTTIDRPDTRIVLNKKNLGYAGANNAGATSDCSTEIVVVPKASPSFSTQASPTTSIVVGTPTTVGDTATFSGGYNVSGNVAFALYSDSGCTIAESLSSVTS